jgi:hypothetical protein
VKQQIAHFIKRFDRLSVKQPRKGEEEEQMPHFFPNHRRILYPKNQVFPGFNPQVLI